MLVVSLLLGSHLEGKTSRWNLTLGKRFPSLSLYSLAAEWWCCSFGCFLGLGRLVGHLQFGPVPAWYPDTMTEFIADICLAQITGQVLFLASYTCFLI